MESGTTKCCSGRYCQCPWIDKVEAFHICGKCKKSFHAFCMGSDFDEETSVRRCAMCVEPNGLSNEVCRMNIPAVPQGWIGPPGYKPNSSPTSGNREGNSSSENNSIAKKQGSKAHSIPGSIKPPARKKGKGPKVTLCSKKTTKRSGPNKSAEKQTPKERGPKVIKVRASKSTTATSSVPNGSKKKHPCTKDKPSAQKCRSNPSVLTSARKTSSSHESMSTETLLVHESTGIEIAAQENPVNNSSTQEKTIHNQPGQESNGNKPSVQENITRLSPTKESTVKKKALRASKGQISNRHLLAGPDIYFDQSKATSDITPYRGYLQGKVVRCNPSIKIEWNKALITDKQETIDEMHLRIDVPVKDRAKVLDAVKRYDSLPQSSQLATRRKRKGTTKQLSKDAKKPKEMRACTDQQPRKVKETPDNVRNNPLNVVQRDEDSAARMQRTNAWEKIMDDSAMQLHMNDDCSESSDEDDEERRVQLYHFEGTMGDFTIDPNPVAGGDGGEVSDEEQEEEDFDDFDKYFDARYPQQSAIVEVDSDSDQQDTSGNDCNKFIRYRFENSIDHELPDCDAEDYVEHGLDGISPDMEDSDGKWNNTGDKRLNYKFEDLPDPLPPQPSRKYAPENPSLKDDVPPKTWESALDCFFYVSGMDEEFFEEIASNMTGYVDEEIENKGRNLFHGYQWSGIPFTGEEVIRHLGIVLKISLDGRVSGSYRQYFFPGERTFTIATGVTYFIEELTPWAKDLTTYARFTQFLGAFRGRIRASPGVEDKGYQLRPFINAINTGAQRIFNPGRHLSFDEGGCTSRSRRNPIRQYNQNKPNPFRVEFFVLAEAVKYFIYHIDVYLGKNAAFIDVHRLARQFPTTQRVVINAVLKSRIANSADGWRCVWMDSRYSAPLAFQLCRKLKVLCGGTMRKNRKGWNSDVMNLSKQSPRGTSLRKYDHVNEQLAIQWNDNKVVSFLTTVIDFQMENVNRRKGRYMMRYVTL